MFSKATDKKHNSLRVLVLRVISNDAVFPKLRSSVVFNESDPLLHSGENIAATYIFFHSCFRVELPAINL